MQEIVVVLPDIRSIHNVGSMFRTADSAGVKKIYLTGITPTPLDRFGKVRQEFSKVSLGAEKFIPWEYKESASRVLTALKKEGYCIVAVEQAKGSVPHHTLRRKYKKIAMVMGNEVKGLSKTLLKKADVIAEIPMHGGKESLNVSVAFGVMVYGVNY